VWLLLGLAGCSADPDEEADSSPPRSLELSFSLSSVPVATGVPASVFAGVSLSAVDAEQACGSGKAERLIEVHRAAVQVGQEVWIELSEGSPKVPQVDAGARLRERLSQHEGVAADVVQAECLSGQSLSRAAPVLIAIESGIPLSTVQLLLQSMAEVGIDQPSLLVAAERVLGSSDWSSVEAPPLLSGPGLELDTGTVPAHGVVSLGDERWNQTAVRHSELVALGVGCVSYAWGAGDSSPEMAGESVPSSIDSISMLPILALAPPQIARADGENSGESLLVNGARCAAWGQLGPSGSRPDVEG
jgi:hypothetical protein